MSTESNSKPEIELFHQLSAILGLPKSVTKLSLHFEACHPLIADVAFYPDVTSALVVEKRFACRLTELEDCPPLQAPGTGVAWHGVDLASPTPVAAQAAQGVV